MGSRQCYALHYNDGYGVQVLAAAADAQPVAFHVRQSAMQELAIEVGDCSRHSSLPGPADIESTERRLEVQLQVWEAAML